MEVTCLEANRTIQNTQAQVFMDLTKSSLSELLSFVTLKVARNTLL